MVKKFRLQESKDNIYRFHSWYGNTISEMIDRMIKQTQKFDIIKIEEVKEDVSEGRAYTS